ncbi:hypothetical protein C8R47DRAFT_1282518 [Mycena vitilis]|nr:hypothetical protein C8R47DRAFT_1282518 [Mycena vitilis]
MTTRSAVPMTLRSRSSTAASAVRARPTPGLGVPDLGSPARRASLEPDDLNLLEYAWKLVVDYERRPYKDDETGLKLFKTVASIAKDEQIKALCGVVTRFLGPDTKPEDVDAWSELCEKVKKAGAMDEATGGSGVSKVGRAAEGRNMIRHVDEAAVKGVPTITAGEDADTWGTLLVPDPAPTLSGRGEYQTDQIWRGGQCCQARGSGGQAVVRVEAARHTPQYAPGIEQGQLERKYGERGITQIVTLTLPIIPPTPLLPVRLRLVASACALRARVQVQRTRMHATVRGCTPPPTAAVGHKGLNRTVRTTLSLQQQLSAQRPPHSPLPRTDAAAPRSHSICRSDWYRTIRGIIRPNSATFWLSRFLDQCREAPPLPQAPFLALRLVASLYLQGRL